MIIRFTDGIDEAAVRDALRRAALDAPVELRPFPTKGDSSVWRADYGDRALFVKAAPRERVHAEVWFYTRASALDVAVPRVVATDIELGDVGWFVSEDVGGEAMNHLEVKPPMLAELGGLLRHLHAQTVEGFGIIGGDPARGSADGLRDSLTTAWSADVRQLADAGRIDDRTIRVVEGLLEQSAPWLGEVQQGRLLHGDLATDHVHVRSDGRIAAILDPAPTAGEPALEFAWWAIHEPDHLGPILDGYGRDTAIEERITVYAVLRTIGEARWCMQHDVRYERVADVVTRLLR